MNLKARSKFRFAEFAHLSKQQIFEDVPISDSLIDSDFCSASPRYIAVVLNSSNAGLATILDRSQPFRFNSGSPRLIGHKRPISDVQFSPFEDDLLATASDDGFVGIWRVHAESDIREPIAMFQPTPKKISSLQFSQTVQNLLLISSWDGHIFLYDISTQTPVVTIQFSQNEDEPEIPASAVFDWSGQRIFAVGKDSKTVKVFRSATGELITQFQAKTTGVKPPHLTSCGSTGCLCISGANRNQERVFYFIDAEYNQIGDPLVFQQSSSLFLSFWDENTKLLHAVSRGSTEYIAFEYENGRFDQVLQMPCEYPTKGACLVPTRAVDTSVTEVAVLVILNSKGQVLPMSLRVPSKTVGFNKKFYGKCFAGKPALSIAEFLQGATADPVEISWSENGALTESGAAIVSVQRSVSVPSTQEAAPQIDKVVADAQNAQPNAEIAVEAVAVQEEPQTAQEEAQKTEMQLLREELEFLKKRVDVLEARCQPPNEPTDSQPLQPTD